MTDLVYLVRHGEVHNPEGIVYADLDGYGLSELGRAQASAAGRRLPGQVKIVSSPLERAVETASIIAATTGSTVESDDDLTEWLLSRRWAGAVWASLDETFPGELTAYLDHPDHLPFAPESLTQLSSRVSAAVRRHRAADGGPLVVVSHQDPIQAARLSLTARPLGGLQRDKPAHAAIITLVPTNGAWQERSTWAPEQGRQFPPIDS